MSFRYFQNAGEHVHRTPEYRDSPAIAGRPDSDFCPIEHGKRTIQNYAKLKNKI